MRRLPRGRAAFDGFVLLILGIASIYPLYWLFAISLQSPSAAYRLPPRIIFSPDFSNYDRLLKDAGFRSALTNSLLVAVPATFICVVAGTMAGFALSRYRLRAAPTFMGLLLVTRLVPAFAIVIPTFFLYDKLNLLDTIPGLVLAMAAFHLPIAVLIMYRMFEGISRSLDEAALIDGATPAQVLGRVLLPVTLPGMAAAGVVTFALIWNEFLFILVLAGDRILTLPVLISTFETQRQILWGPIAAASILAVTPMILVVLFAQKALLGGLGAGAVRE